ncbi:MAG: polysaccharide biosynthesis/export family protein, partial [Syntrophobacterales bacterium]|nr:polysaccharide biosynthesis/export family protein [Syntrophobacterales bacterium]
MGLNALRIVVFIMGIVSLAACTPNTVVNPAPFTQFDQQARSYSQQEYVIAPGDILDVKFVNYPELNELAMPVRPDGRISLQMVP